MTNLTDLIPIGTAKNMKRLLKMEYLKLHKRAIKENNLINNKK
jgi:hypothetical protein|tara:strand:- start:355 stop:483 length:129 start_codon:yes stop_codon:yes gene_type:complete